MHNDETRHRTFREKDRLLSMTESPLHKSECDMLYISSGKHLPQEHLADEAILVNWLLVFAFGHFRPHLGSCQYACKKCEGDRNDLPP